MLKALRYGIGSGSIGLWSLYWLAELNRTQWLGRQDIEDLQLRKLFRILKSAQAGVPYWRDRLVEIPSCTSAVKPSVREWIRQFPVLSKDSIRQQPAAYLSRRYPNAMLHWYSTGGSTGEPIKIAKNRGNVMMTEAAVLRGRSWVGIMPGDCVADVKGYEPASWAGRMRMHLLKQYKIDAYGLQRKSRRSEISFIQSIKPRCLAGYPTSLLRFIELGYPPIPSLRMVFSTGEMLYPEQRRKIEKALDVRVSDHYGCNEIGAVAFECEFGAKHITEERVLVETLDDSNQPVWEKSGRLVLTDLDNFAMPLIRYEVGDIGVLTRIPCACGRSATVLKSLEGRVQDALRSRDGRILPSLMIASLFRDMTGVKAYQIIQHDFNNLTLKYVPTGRKELESNLDTIGNVIRSQLGAAIQIKLEHCETIPTAASGKIRLVVGMKTDNPRPTPGDGQPPNLNPTPA